MKPLVVVGGPALLDGKPIFIPQILQARTLVEQADIIGM
jgi:hypothetical protein